MSGVMVAPARRGAMQSVGLHHLVVGVTVADEVVEEGAPGGRGREGVIHVGRHVLVRVSLAGGKGYPELVPFVVVIDRLDRGRGHAATPVPPLLLTPQTPVGSAEFVLPARHRAREWQRFGLVDAARDGAGDDVGGE